jgi:DNA-binding CsgD family transcriptional regulator
MATVSAHDRGSLFEAVGAIAETTTLPELRHATATLIGTLIPTTLAAWNEIDTTGMVEVVTVPDMPHWPGGPEAFEEHMGDHPVIGHYQRTGDGRPYAISDFLTTDQYHSTALYQTFYRRLGAEDQLSFILPDPHRLVGIALNRDRRGFSERDHAVANLFRPHLTHAYTNVRAYERVHVLTAALNTFAEVHNEGLILLDRHSRPEYISREATRLLTVWFPSEPGPDLPASVQEWVAAAGQLPLTCEHQHQQLLIRLIASTGTGTRALLLVESDTLDQRDLLQRLGLTARQSEVVDLATQGLTNTAIAERLWISTRTVEGHIGQSLRRLGVESRTAATHLLRQMMA